MNICSQFFSCYFLLCSICFLIALLIHIDYFVRRHCCMTRGSSSSPLLNPDPEVERNFRRKLRQVHLSDSGSVEVSVEVNQEANMADNH